MYFEMLKLLFHPTFTHRFQHPLMIFSQINYCCNGQNIYLLVFYCKELSLHCHLCIYIRMDYGFLFYSMHYNPFL